MDLLPYKLEQDREDGLLARGHLAERVGVVSIGENEPLVHRRGTVVDGLDPGEAPARKRGAIELLELAEIVSLRMRTMALAISMPDLEDLVEPRDECGKLVRALLLALRRLLLTRAG